MVSKIKYFFEDENKRNQLGIILNEWLDTPFKHKAAVKGMGCDCVHFAIKVFEELKLIKLKPGMIPDYPRDWHIHNTQEALKAAVEKHLLVDMVDLKGVLLDGDIILSHYGKASSHTGIFYQDHVFQAIDGIGVKSIHFDDKKFKPQMKFVYRIKA